MFSERQKIDFGKHKGKFSMDGTYLRCLRCTYLRMIWVLDSMGGTY